MGGPEVERLIALLARLPGFGPRSARRAALRLLMEPEIRMAPLAAALRDAAHAVSACRGCGNLDSMNPCTICADPMRDHSVICVVESVGDVWALERGRLFRGMYHVLGGVLSPLNGMGPDDLRIASLLARLEAGKVQEVILALPATVDGATTSHWLADLLLPIGVAITRLGHGVPMGGTLDTLDDGTLAAALRGRQPA